MLCLLRGRACSSYRSDSEVSTTEEKRGKRGFSLLVLRSSVRLRVVCQDRGVRYFEGTAGWPDVMDQERSRERFDDAKMKRKTSMEWFSALRRRSEKNGEEKIIHCCCVFFFFFFCSTRRRLSLLLFPFYICFLAFLMRMKNKDSATICFLTCGKREKESGDRAGGKKGGKESKNSFSSLL